MSVRVLLSVVSVAILMPGLCCAAPATPRPVAAQSAQLLRSAQIQLQDGKTAAALSLYRNAVQLNPDDPQARKCFAYALVVAGYPRQGAQQMELAVNAQGSSAEWSFIADAYSRSGDQARAMKCLQQALLSDQNNPLLLITFAEVQQKAGLLKEARTAAAKALALGSDQPEIKARAMYVLTDHQANPLSPQGTRKTVTPTNNDPPGES